jgi:hypothetical protein
MPVAGRKPKPPGQAVNRVKPVYDWVDVPDRPFEDGPRLPSRRACGKGWPASVKRWWRVVSAMPHCVLWAESDWLFAEQTAELVARFYLGDARLGPEVRQRERVLGTTADFRRDLRIRYVEDVAAAGEDATVVTRLDDYRDL